MTRAKAKMIQSGFDMKIFYLNRTEDESGVSGTGGLRKDLFLTMAKWL